MFHPRRLSTPGNKSVNRIFKLKRSLLLPLLVITALVGVVFSGASRSVHSSDAVEQSAKTGGAATKARDGNSPSGFVRTTAKSGAQTSSSDSTPAGASGNAQDSGGGDQVALNHARTTPNFFPALPLLPTVTATKTDALVNDDGDNKIDPTNGNALTEERITYTVTITSSGADATHLKFNDTIDPHTTLVPGSVNTQPIANADTYSASGNIPLSLAVGSGVLANDVDPDNGSNSGLTVTEVQGAAANVGAATNTTATGRGGVKGSVTVAANGSFTYEPPPGFEGADTFTYKTSDGTATDTATVTINISGMVWFISNTGGGLNRGTFSNPFTTIASFNTANAASGNMPDPKNGDFISLRTGSGTYTETDGVNLRNTQKLIGNAIQFNTVFTAATNSSSAYTTFAGAAGSAPNIVTTGGNGVDLADSNTVRGLNVGNTTGFKINGGAVGSPIINTINLTGSGGAINVSASGTFGANVTFATLESTSSAASNINLVSVTGTLGVTSGGTGLSGSTTTTNAITINGGSVSLSYPGNVTKANVGSLVNVSNGHSGTLTFTGTLSATAGDGLQFNNCDGTYNFNGTTTLNGGDAGIDITNGSVGTFSFNSNTSITNPTNEAITISSSAAGVTYSGSFSKSNGTRGILIQSNTGGTILFNGSGVTKSISTSGAVNAIDLLSNSGTTINFTNNSLVLTASGTGIALNATGGGTITVQGTSNTLTAAANLTVGTGAALNVVNTNIGASGLTFQSINVNGASSAIVLNNVGTTVGTNGGLSVTGTGTTAGSGGTIQNNVQGALFTQTRDLSLKNMNFTNANSGNGTCSNVDSAAFNNACQAAINMNTVTNATFDNLNMDGGNQVGINGRTVSGFSLLNSTVKNFGDTTNENDVRLFNLTGTATITNCDFSFAAGDTTAGESLVDIRNDTGTLTLNVDGDPANVNSNNFTNTQDSATGSYGLTVTAVSSATATVNVRRSNFLNIRTAGVATFSRNTATMNVNITGGGNSANGNTFDPSLPKLGRAIDLNAEDTANLNFNINENPKIYGTGGPIINIFGTDNAQINGHIRNNPDIKNAGATLGNTAVGSAIYFHPEDSSDGRVEITGNTISGMGQDKTILLLNHGNGAALLDGVIDGIVANNTISLATAKSNNTGVYLNSGANAGDVNKVCGYIHDNSVTLGSASQFGLVVFTATSGSNVYLQNFSNANPDPAISTWDANNNTPTGKAISGGDHNPVSASAAPFNGTCRAPTNAVAMLFDSDPNSTLARSGEAYSSLGSTLASLTADYIPASEVVSPAPSTDEFRTASASTEDAATQAQVSSATAASLTAIAQTPEEIPATALNTAQTAARVEKKRGAMQLSHAIRTRTRPRAMAVAMFAGETVTIDGGAGTGNTGFTLPAGKSITVTFQVTLNNLPNVTANPYPTGGPQVSNQGTVTADSIAAVLTDDPAPPAPLSNGATDPTVTFADLFNSQTSVGTSNASSLQGDPVTFTATVSFLAAGSPSGTPGTPTGTVDFFDGTAIPANAIAGCSAKTLDGSGVATCSTSALTPGAHTITARYNGDGNFDTSTGTVPQTVIACTNNPIVTSTADSGANTLRDALSKVCASPSNNITFNLGAGAHTITTLSTLVIGRDANITNTIGAGNGPLTVTANNGNFNVFRVDSPVTTASLNGFTVTGVLATSVSGGGLLAQSGTVTLSGMLFTGNTVINGDGGGVTAGSSSTVNIRNSTISGNTARHGGGLFSSGGTFNLLNVTVTNNNANGDTGTGACPAGGSVNGAGGAIETGGNPTNIKNSILAGNTACNAGALNVSGASTDQGNNILSGDPRLAALTDNGGATRTHALLIDSPALDAGDNTAADAVPLTTDQRGTGFARKLDSADAGTTQTVDIGAYEADPTLEDITDKSTNEDTAIVIPFNVGDSATAFDSITATSSDTTLVPNLPANISITGSGGSRNLNITPAANRSGTTTITVTVTKTISSKTLSMADTFVLTVNEVNDPPSFTLPGNPAASNEDAGPQTVNAYATSISQGPNETGQTLTFNVSVTGTTGTLAFTTAPAIDPTTGNLTYEASPNTNGTANVSVTLSDDGSNVSPNSNTSAAQFFTITVSAVNDAPSFTIAGDPPTINDNAGAQTVNGFATGISAGPSDESGQTLTFNVSPTGSTGTLTFSSAPAINPTTGTLTYTANNGTDGTASFDVTLSDNGSNVAPNVNTSAAQSFTITVNGVNDPPVNTVPGPITIPQDTVLTFVGGNQISVTDPDAANAPSDGIITVTLSATNGTLTLSSTTGLVFSAGDGTSDTTMTFDGLIADINSALTGMTFTPTAGYTGAASVQIVSNDQGKTGTGGVKTDDDTVNITVVAPTAMYINEVSFNPDASGQNEYIELRGTPSSVIPAGTYFVAVDGDNGNLGDVTTYINLSGLSFGSNGFLVLLQQGNTYTTAAGATVVTSTTTGFGGLPGGIFQADGGATSLENDSVTFMLIETGVSPTLSDDIDFDNDGTPDGSVYAGWSIRDSIGNVDGTDAGDHGYGAINYSSTGSGSSTGTVVPVTFALTYVGRRGDTTGSAAADWVASCALDGAAPNFTLDTSSTEVEPPSFAGKTLDHIGTTNFLNKAPVNTVPGAQATDEDVPLVFNAGNGNKISIDDQDAGTQDVKVTLSATNGTFSLSGIAGLTFTTGDGTDDAQMVFTGTLTDINAALDGLTFTPPLNFSGASSLQIVTDDQGNVGVDGAKTDDDTINITVNAVNDPPSFVIPAAAPTVDEDAGAQTVSGFATSISQGAGDPAQTLTFNVTLSGVSTLGFSSGPAIDPTTGNLTYTTSPDSNGTATFNVTLSDNGSNVAPNSNTSGVQQFTITVNAVNDAPSFQIPSAPPSVNEDAAAQTGAGFATSFQPGPVTATDEAGQTLVGYTLTQTGTTGNLTFTAGPSIDNAGQLTYTPTGNTSGTATYNAVATDSGPGSAPDVNQSAPVSFTITVIGQNDAPVLDNAGNMSLNAINEDVPNASNTGTLVVDIIASAGGDRITDVDAGAVEGIAVTLVDNTNGAWQYSIDNGTNWTPFSGLSVTTARLLAADAQTRIRFVPNADFNGTIDPGITFLAWDQSSGTNGNTGDATTTGGTTAFSTATETASITVNQVNDAPTANADVLSNVGEDSGLRIIPFASLTGNDVKGPANESAQSLIVKTVSSPVGGSVSISGGNVLFTPTADYNGPASFQYTVEDDGVPPLTSAAAALVSFQITPTPDTPSVTNATTNEDTQTTTGLVITPNPGDGPEVTNYQVTGITGGTLFQNNGATPINNGDFISIAQGAAGLKFTPSPNSNANGSFQVQASLSATPAGLGGGLATATITVNPVNDTPYLDALNNVLIQEDASIQTVVMNNIQAGDGETGALTITATSDNTGLIPNPTVNYTSPNAIGTLNFTPVPNQNGSALITVTVTDDGGTANGGINTMSRTFTVTVTPVNDAPVNTVPGAQTTVRNTALTFSAANGNLISVGDDAGANPVQVSLAASGGTLTLASTAGLGFTTGDGTADAAMTFTGTLASINAALSSLTFTPTTDYVGAASVQINTNDLGNTGAGGPLSDTDTVNITINDRTLQFSQPSFTVNESSGHATITVTRLGGTSIPASVDYATGDLSGLTNCNVVTGNASPRCDFTAMAGTLNFPVGQSVASFDIPIINDVYVEGPETLPINLSNAQGATLSTPTTTLTITDNDLAPGAPNPINDPAFFVRLQYMDILNREPEAQGLADWLAILQNCPVGDTTCDLVEVSSGFFRSPEFFARAYYIYRFYEVGLGRKPDYDEYQRDFKMVAGFLTNAELEARKQQFAFEFSQRPEFKARYDQYDSATHSQEYVDALAQTAGVTLANRQQLNYELANSIKQRWDVLRAVVESPEVSQKFFNKAFVVIGYFAYLRRDPDAQYLVWLAQLNNPPAGKTEREVYRDMIAGFIFSPEYRQRFGP